MALVTGAHRKSEDVRVQIRKIHQASLKRGKYEKHSIELEEVSSAFGVPLRHVLMVARLKFQKLTDRHIGDVDKIIADLKKATGAGKK